MERDANNDGMRTADTGSRSALRFITVFSIGAGTLRCRIVPACPLHTAGGARFVLSYSVVKEYP
jgi:hypothetical protein